MGLGIHRPGFVEPLTGGLRLAEIQKAAGHFEQRVQQRWIPTMGIAEILERALVLTVRTLDAAEHKKRTNPERLMCEQGGAGSAGLASSGLSERRQASWDGRPQRGAVAGQRVLG